MSSAISADAADPVAMPITTTSAQKRALYPATIPRPGTLGCGENHRREGEPGGWASAIGNAYHAHDGLAPAMVLGVKLPVARPYPAMTTKKCAWMVEKSSAWS